MKDMLEPRMAAARIQGSADRGQGAAAGTDRITPSSQGALSTFTMAR
jgi:hypothetical protein